MNTTVENALAYLVGHQEYLHAEPKAVSSAIDDESRDWFLDSLFGSMVAGTYLYHFGVVILDGNENGIQADELLQAASLATITSGVMVGSYALARFAVKHPV